MITRVQSKVGLLISALIVATFMPAPAYAALSASVATLALGNKGYSHSNQTSTGTMVLTAAAGALDVLGWKVTILSSAFVYSGPNSGSNIPAANFSLTSAAEPVRVSGQAIDPLGIGGPKVPATSPLGALNVARKTVQAVALFGKGTYTQDLGVSLLIPGQSLAGTYTGTLTTTISVGP